MEAGLISISKMFHEYFQCHQVEYSRLETRSEALATPPASAESTATGNVTLELSAAHSDCLDVKF